MLTLDKIYHASYVLKDVVRRTELIPAPYLNKKGNIFLKPENLQLTGSFKVRGSYYKISQLSAEEKAKGVIACSAGNHAQGVALAATRNGIKSTICLPDCAPISKVEATRGYGAEICLVEGVYDDAYKRAIELRDEMGYTFIHPFDDIDVIAGQGTIGLELIDQMKDVEVDKETLIKFVQMIQDDDEFMKIQEINTQDFLKRLEVVYKNIVFLIKMIAKC